MFKFVAACATLVAVFSPGVAAYRIKQKEVRNLFADRQAAPRGGASRTSADNLHLHSINVSVARHPTDEVEDVAKDVAEEVENKTLTAWVGNENVVPVNVPDGATVGEASGPAIRPVIPTRHLKEDPPSQTALGLLAAFFVSVSLIVYLRTRSVAQAAERNWGTFRARARFGKTTMSTTMKTAFSYGNQESSSSSDSDESTRPSSSKAAEEDANSSAEVTDPHELFAQADSAKDGEPVTTTLSVMKETMDYVVPMFLIGLVVVSVGLISTSVIGRYGTNVELAAMGIGATIQGMLCGTLTGGFSSALDTLISQAVGSGNHPLAVHYLQQARLLMTASLFVIVPVSLNIEPILLAMGQDAHVALVAANYSRMTGWNFFFGSHQVVSCSFVRSYKDFRIPTASSIFSLVAQVALSVLFVGYWRMGLNGMMYVTMINSFLGAVLVHGMLWHMSPVRKYVRTYRLFLVEYQTFIGLGRLCRLAGPISLAVISETWFTQLTIVFVGNLGANAESALVTASGLTGMLAVLPGSFAAAAGLMTGIAMGAKQPLKARKTATTVLFFNWALWFFCCVVMFYFKDALVGIYGFDGEVRQLTTNLIVIGLLIGFSDVCKNSIEGPLRVMGFGVHCALIRVVAYYPIALPIGYYLAFHMKWGVYGFQVGLFIGFTILAVSYTTLLYRINFPEKAAKHEAIMEAETETMERAHFKRLERMAARQKEAVQKEVAEAQAKEEAQEAQAAKMRAKESQGNQKKSSSAAPQPQPDSLPRVVKTAASPRQGETVATIQYPKMEAEESRASAGELPDGVL